jgi:hypothetical protein
MASRRGSSGAAAAAASRGRTRGQRQRARANVRAIINHHQQFFKLFLKNKFLTDFFHKLIHNRKKCLRRHSSHSHSLF